MTAQMKRFPARPPLTPQQIELGEVSEHLRALARKADLLAYAFQGVMALEENDDLWPLQEVAFELKHKLNALANELPK
jgi:hypothetical protein